MLLDGSAAVVTVLGVSGMTLESVELGVTSHLDGAGESGWIGGVIDPRDGEDLGLVDGADTTTSGPFEGVDGSGIGASGEDEMILEIEWWRDSMVSALRRPRELSSPIDATWLRRCLSIKFSMEVSSMLFKTLCRLELGLIGLGAGSEFRGGRDGDAGGVRLLESDWLNRRE